MEDITVEDLIVELNALRIRVAQLEAAQGAAANTDNGNLDDAVAFRRGDRIRIINRVRRPSNWDTGVVWEEDKERTATVTRVTPNKTKAKEKEGCGGISYAAVRNASDTVFL